MYITRGPDNRSSPYGSRSLTDNNPGTEVSDSYKKYSSFWSSEHALVGVTSYTLLSPIRVHFEMSKCKDINTGHARETETAIYDLH